MTKPTILTDDDKREILRLYTEENVGLRRLAILFHVGTPVLREIVPVRPPHMNVGQRRLTAEQVVHIREERQRLQRRVTVAELAEKYGVSLGAMKKLLEGYTYKDVGGPISTRESYAAYRKRHCKRGHDLVKRPPDKNGICRACRSLLRAARKKSGSRAERVVTVKQVIGMRNDYASGKFTLTQLAKTYGHDRVTVTSIVRGECYQDLPGPITPKGPKYDKEFIQRVIDLRTEFRKHPYEVTLDQLGAQFGFSEQQVSNMVRGKSYTDIGGPITPPAMVKRIRKRMCKRGHDKTKHPLKNGQCRECRRMTIKKSDIKRGHSSTSFGSIPKGYTMPTRRKAA